jgi:hypothetical protein
MIVEGMERDPAFAANGRHISLAHWLVLSADWDLIDRLLPKQLNTYSTSGWLESLRAGIPVDAKGDPIPWFTYPSVDFIEPKIQSGWRVFEWGSGFSTLWWSKRVASVDSIESNESWINEVRGRAGENVTLSFCPDEASYVGAIERHAKHKLDVIVIDGDHRNACAKVALNYIKPNGLIIFDNSDGPEFDEGVAYLTEQGWKRLDFFGPIPSYLYKNCTSIFFNDDAFLKYNPNPSTARLSTGPTCFQLVHKHKVEAGQA